MEQVSETLFISFEEFKEYSEKEQFEFLKKMKRHRLMRHQAIAWGFGENYLSQHYFKLRTNTKAAKSAAEKRKGKSEGKSETKNVKSTPLHEKSGSLQEEKKQEEKKVELVPTIPVSQEAQLSPKTKESIVRVSAESICPDIALTLLATLRKEFSESTMECKFIDTEDGCDLLFVATSPLAQ